MFIIGDVETSHNRRGNNMLFVKRIAGAAALGATLLLGAGPVLSQVQGKCPVSFSAGQQDGVCLSNGSATSQSAVLTDTQGESFNVGIGPAIPNLTSGIVYLTYPGEPGIPGLTGSPANTS